MRSSPIDVAPSRTAYRGRFAPSPTGPLHAGSLVAALASWLDARAHDGCWLLRIEDLDPPREVPGAADDIVATLLAFGLEPDEPVARQSERSALYQAAVDRLAADGRLYACTCSRRTLELAAPGRAAYPGTCRHRGLPLDTPQAALRVRVDDVTLRVRDRSGAVLEQRLAHEVGDFVLRRADGWWAYQLAVVVDDAAQGITDIVRGADLWDNTPRQQWLHELLGTTAPRTLHVPVVTAATGEKLSKQTGAQPLDRSNVLGELRRAWQHLGFAPFDATTPAQFLRAAIAPWRERWPLRGSMRR